MQATTAINYSLNAKSGFIMLLEADRKHKATYLYKRCDYHLLAKVERSDNNLNTWKHDFFFSANTVQVTELRLHR